MNKVLVSESDSSVPGIQEKRCLRAKSQRSTRWELMRLSLLILGHGAPCMVGIDSGYPRLDFGAGA